MQANARAHVLPGLDGLRAISVLLVVLFHDLLLGVGWCGVQIFFVLSGYLITKGLAREREAPLGTYLKNFYGRRTLRIFPLYYAVIALLFALVKLRPGFVGVQDALPYAATYTYNIHHALTAGWSYIGHFWSLCVEEQVYLLWPLLIFFCPPARLPLALGVIIVLGMPVRFFEALLIDAMRPEFSASAVTYGVYVLTPSHLDAFAVGALASLYPPTQTQLKRITGVAAALFVAASTLMLTFARDEQGMRLPLDSIGFPIGLYPAHGYVWAFLLFNVLSAAVICTIVQGGTLSRMLDFKPISYVGKISYGIYVIHFPVQRVLELKMPTLNAWQRLPIQLAITLAIASASFHLFESPILKLKDKWFPSTRAARTE